MFLYIYYYLQSVNFNPFAAKKKRPKGQHKSKLKEMREKKIPYSPKIMSPERKWISGFLLGYYNLNLLQLTRKKNTI